MLKTINENVLMVFIQKTQDRKQILSKYVLNDVFPVIHYRHHITYIHLIYISVVPKYWSHVYCYSPINIGIRNIKCLLCFCLQLINLFLIYKIQAHLEFHSMIYSLVLRKYCMWISVTFALYWHFLCAKCIEAICMAEPYLVGEQTLLRD